MGRVWILRIEGYVWVVESIKWEFEIRIVVDLMIGKWMRFRVFWKWKVRKVIEIEKFYFVILFMFKVKDVFFWKCFCKFFVDIVLWEDKLFIKCFWFLSIEVMFLYFENNLR